MIVAVPVPVAVVKPEPATTVATAVLSLLQVPPVVPSDMIATWPTHIDVVPEIATGDGLTVTTVEAVQLAGVVYIMVEVPGVMPDNSPELNPIVAMPVEPEVQVPPVTASDSVMERPAHTVAGAPLIGSIGLTVTTTLTGVQFALV